ncbi:UDP-2,3-diacylglucosamine diphosphatase [Synoicihabitans lomoniglobus]|uniref:UDP-2,3-diacylglucosamine diphosphatase n=1 Tax=Synoicihabitans lomoniglobus TaxID=2909285 RepID=UPI002ED4BBD1|nr:UDP-2,3-diacylglucosamine diphosphatase [Opitutaceae bacterium LMO-M01]
MRTVIISDVHLGTDDCKVHEVNHFLKYTRCEKIILNGDIIDGWRLKKTGHWPKSHTRFIRLILKKLEKKNTEVIYLRGNHDDVLAKFLPIAFENLQIVEDYVHTTPRGNYFVLHGDVFDTVTKNFVFLAYLGDWGYRLLMRINRLYNRWRTWRGKDYYSLSKAVKARVKRAVSHVSNFEEHIVELARSRDCMGVMCGHIHTAADKMFGDVHYLNSGDWVESLTAIVEHLDGRFEIVDFADFVKSYPMPSEIPTDHAEVLELPEDIESIAPPTADAAPASA